MSGGAMMVGGVASKIKLTGVIRLPETATPVVERVFTRRPSGENVLKVRVNVSFPVPTPDTVKIPSVLLKMSTLCG